MSQSTAAEKETEALADEPECRILSSIILALIIVFSILLVTSYNGEQTLDLKSSIHSNGERVLDKNS